MGAVQARDVAIHSIIGLHVAAAWSGRILTVPVLRTLTRRIGLAGLIGALLRGCRVIGVV
jgi:hypothetical protein